ncbi:MAG: hypothetical protein AOA65_0725 [Candidatus Bathyarchaeota archaeon BA1]|nr:MAG: hypothetical protein AOA65_0725 [Candidatus Bathyarchaeota archaeon BA1]
MRKLLKKPSSSALIALFIAAIFAVSMAATVYYSYLVPYPAHLRILHDHSSQMVSEVVSDFKAWYQGKYGRLIEVSMIPTDPQIVYRKVTYYLSSEAEVWWGGPPPLFEKAYTHLLPYNSTYKNEINATCYSCPLMELKRATPHWYVASLYGLGLIYNEQALRSLNLPIPQTWADLLKEEYDGNIAMVDPAKSEFTLPFITLILQSKNWTSGWEYLVRLSALIRKYDESEVNSALKVAAGYIPLAVLPDFYAYDKMAVYPRLRFTYLDATVLQPDPIAIIKRGVYLDEAKAFIDYILTERAQTVLGKHRLPIRRDVTPSPPRINPFTPAFPYIRNYNKTFQEIGKGIVKDYYQAWVTERHEQIKTAWTVIREANKTKHLNPNATRYYNLAWSNFTYAGYYANRTEIDAVHGKTKGWTQNTTLYMNKWREASKKAYQNATENAKKSKQSAKTTPSSLMSRTQNSLRLYALRGSFFAHFKKINENIRTSYNYLLSP